MEQTPREPAVTVELLTETLLEPLVSADREIEAHRQEVTCPPSHNQNSSHHEVMGYDGLRWAMMGAINSFSPHDRLKRWVLVILPILQMMKLSPREGKRLVQGHRVRKR